MTDTQEQGKPAVGFLVVAFTDENLADQALAELKEAKSKKEFDFEDAAVIRQDADGKVKYYETGDMGAGKGAGIGALVGGVLGILGGPVGVLLGAGIGAGIGGVAASGDKGYRDENLNTVGVALKPGTSAIALITSHEALKAIQQSVPIEDIHTAVGNLSEELSARLAENKNVAIGLILSEDGLAVAEIAANEDGAQVVGAVITSDGIVAGEAVITDEGVAYKVAGANADGAAMEAGVITDEGAVVVDAVATPELPESRESSDDKPTT